MNPFDLMSYIKEVGRVVTIDELAEVRHSQGACTSVESCKETILQFMRSGLIVPTQIGCPDCNKSRGLGDTISKITHALHIPECGGCKQRRDILNKWVPYDG